MTRVDTVSKAIASKSLWFGLLLLCCALLSACNLESDAALMSNFEVHRKDFEKLVDMSNSDRGVAGVQVMENPPSDLPISPQRWHEYQSLFQELGLKVGLERREDFPSGIFLTEECSGTAITHDCKGYVYSAGPLAPLQENLDKPPAKVVFRRIDHNWYLFRDDG
ncbi:MAG: hypothetical protein ABSD59_00985 [Terracidiphilus sp.]|jgi:hypothetical protein